jgi:hypothetical protein
MNKNVQFALVNYGLWLSWYPGDFKGAIEFAGDSLDTVEEVDEFSKEIEKLVKEGSHV